MFPWGKDGQNEEVRIVQSHARFLAERSSAVNVSVAHSVLPISPAVKVVSVDHSVLPLYSSTWRDKVFSQSVTN
ncbi:hypothetical protein E2C01_055326 [Portunus trituberculatus]|uniref:Uncharacterized protein n=1 Tax=Portunus trituberculatus TaxID=210409 RepID=A0A5B7GWI0_PORTR|nr:hypothetical protein [Portunus trituberculatus]